MIVVKNLGKIILFPSRYKSPPPHPSPSLSPFLRKSENLILICAYLISRLWFITSATRKAMWKWNPLNHVLLLSVSKHNLTITAEIHARSLAKFNGWCADRHMNLKFVRHVSEREREIRQFVIIKNQSMSAFNASVLLLTMNFVISLSK